MLAGLDRLLLHPQAFLGSQTLIRKSSHFDLLMGGGEEERRRIWKIQNKEPTYQMVDQ